MGALEKRKAAEKPKKKNGKVDYNADKQERNPFARTAICAEVRDKKLYLFLPPLDNAETFIDLMASVEAAAKKLSVPVLIEGYEPPRDNRLEVLKVTPDPGVIEVNVHP